MTKDDIIKLAREAAHTYMCSRENPASSSFTFDEDGLKRFANLVAAAERDALEAELLKLKKGIGASSMYIQGRWDLIGEFQDIILARGTP